MGSLSAVSPFSRNVRPPTRLGAAGGRLYNPHREKDLSSHEESLHVIRPLAALLLISSGILPAAGCGTKATRLRSERSALLDQRHAIQQGEPPTLTKSKRRNAEPPVDPTLPPAQQVEELDKRIAELDAELLQYDK